jgi:hypothetical protein
LENRKLKEELKSVKEELQATRNKNSEQLANNNKKEPIFALSDKLLLQSVSILECSQSTK